MRRRIARVLYHLWGVALKLQKPLEMAANPLSPVTAQNRRRIYIMYLTQCTKCLLRSATWGKLCANPVSCRYSPRVEWVASPGWRTRMVYNGTRSDSTPTERLSLWVQQELWLYKLTGILWCGSFSSKLRRLLNSSRTVSFAGCSAKNVRLAF